MKTGRNDDENLCLLVVCGMSALVVADPQRYEVQNRKSNDDGEVISSTVQGNDGGEGKGKLNAI